jgi:hypothetical protein
MKRKLIMTVLIVIIGLASIELLLRFPAELKTDTSLESPAGNTNTFPQVHFSPFVSGDENVKTFYPERIPSFNENLNTIISSNNSSFLKDAEISYVIGGRVLDSKLLKNNFGAMAGYEIRFKDKNGQIYMDKLSLTEMSKAYIYQVSQSEHGSSKSFVTVASIQPGDYVTVKRSINLLDAKQVYTEIEIGH